MAPFIQVRTENSRVIMLYKIYVLELWREKNEEGIFFFFLQQFQSHVRVNFNEGQLLKSVF